MNTEEITIGEYVERLTQIVINVIEENGFGVLSSRFKGPEYRIFNCGAFNIDLCMYSFSDIPCIWLEGNALDMPKYNSLVKQLKLLGFEVNTISYVKEEHKI